MEGLYLYQPSYAAEFLGREPDTPAMPRRKVTSGIRSAAFRVSNENAATGNGMTQFGRANLNIHDGIGGALLYVIERLFARRRAEPPRAPAAGVLCAPTPAPGIFAAMRRCFSLSVPTLVSLMDCRASL